MKKIVPDLFCHCSKAAILIFSSLLFFSYDLTARTVHDESVNSSPTITMSANYCDFPGKVRVTATSDITITNWTWSYGFIGTNTATTSYIEVDYAGTFRVSAQSAGGYTATASMKVAQELVANGDFETGNTGFVSDYLYVSNTVQMGLYPEGTYSVHNAPNFTHSYFFGVDHTSADGTGKFMLVNGTSDKVVWKQTVTVLPNDTYYFSAYAVSLNDVGPFANLKFQVNGVQVGSPTGTLPSKPPDNNSGTWIRFYGKWDSHTATTAEIEIIDLENAANGNDFGLDDISFGTLDPFLNLTSAAGTDRQTSVCGNSPIADIAYEVGSDGNRPVLSNLPAGLGTTWDGRTLGINDTPTTPGIYNYSISGTGCNTITLFGTITVDSPSVGGTLPAVASICFNQGGTLTLANKVGDVTKWMTSSNGGTTWSDVPNTNSATLNFSNITNAVLYKAIVKNNSCKADTSSVVKVGVHNLWTGENTTDWNNNKNWSDETLPSVTLCDTVVIPAIISQVYPVLSSGITSIKNLKVFPGALLTLLEGSTLQVSGSINNYGTIDAVNGTIELNGTDGTDQSIAGSMFKNNMLKNLIISNNVNVSKTLNDTLNIWGTLTFGNTNSKLNTGDNITLKSTALATASLGVVAAGNVISGTVVIERYIAAHKAWRFLSIPTNTLQTVKQTWQEGATNNQSNPVPGYGAQLTGSGGTAAGFDLYSATPSMKKYNSATNAWDGIANTNTVLIKATDGYMVFVRGDRIANAFNSTPTQTVLRTKGNLYTGSQPPILVNPGKFAAIGNPYPSALDVRNITRTGLKDFVYVWDPKLCGNYGLGGYQTFSNNGNGDYVITPGEGSYGPGGSVSNYIQSGQAFFVQATGTTGSLTFKETDKTCGGSPVSLVAGLPRPQLRTALYGVNADNTTYMIDGVLNNYDDSYSNSVDDMDAIKSTNISENLSIKTANTLLVIERRFSIAEKDTIFLNLTNEKVQKYRFQFTADQLGRQGLTGFLEDTYLHTSTLLNLNGSTVTDFNIVNIPGSYAPGRFRIVFRQLIILPVTFTSVKAYQQNKNIAVEWIAENESNLGQYNVEKSVDGNHYVPVKTIAANNSVLSNYSWLDVNPSEGYNYYRIVSKDKNGKTAHSVVVKVLIGKGEQDISIYPNPVINGTINLQLNNQPAGMYGLRLLNNIGQVMMSKQINHAEGLSAEKIQLDKSSAHGIYQLEVTRPDGNTINIKVIY
jgi:hypothetical protein